MNKSKYVSKNKPKNVSIREIYSLLGAVFARNVIYWETQKKFRLSSIEEIIQDDFQYVVEESVQPHVCFLSGCERFPPSKKKGPKTRYLPPRMISGVRALLRKVRSKRGVGGLADIAPRFPKVRISETPGPDKYDLDKKKEVAETAFPFGSSTNPKIIHHCPYPGPGTYDRRPQCRKPKRVHTFGGLARLQPCVEVLCTPKPFQTCLVCEEICKGDFWHLEYMVFICLKCMRIQRKSQEFLTLEELDEFTKIRTCTFMHEHEGTSAAIRLVPKRELCIKFRKENYLDIYFNKYY